MYVYLFIFHGNNSHESPELLVRKDVVSSMRFGRVSMGILPSEKDSFFRLTFLFFYLRAPYSRLGGFTLSHIALA